MKSIRQFLLMGLLGILAISFFIIYCFNHWVTLQQVGELYDTQLAQTSRILQGFVDRPPNEIDFDHLNNALLSATQTYNDNDSHSDNKDKHIYEHKFAIQLWDAEKNLLVKSPTAPMYSIAELTDGYSLKKYGNYDWHIFTQHLASNGYWIVVAGRDDVREDMINNIENTALAGPCLAMILLVLGVIAVVTQGLKPLINISHQIARRNINKLEPLELKNTPTELIPVGEAINFLMQHVSQEVERERRFLGDIAHELRTPLAALKVNAQSGLNTTDTIVAQQAFIKIVRGVDRSNRLIEQLLTLARLDPRALGKAEPIHLLDIIHETVTQLLYEKQNVQQKKGTLGNTIFSENHSDKNIHFDITTQSISTSTPVELTGYPVLVSVLVRNLIDNAYRYSPAQSHINIKLIQTDSTHLILNISDQGPGVPELKLSSLGKRFYRGQPADRMGTGLGLSIVTRIAELHQAQVIFNSVKPHGLSVSIIFSTL